MNQIDHSSENVVSIQLSIITYLYTHACIIYLYPVGELWNKYYYCSLVQISLHATALHMCCFVMKMYFRKLVVPRRWYCNPIGHEPRGFGQHYLSTNRIAATSPVFLEPDEPETTNGRPRKSLPNNILALFTGVIPDLLVLLVKKRTCIPFVLHIVTFLIALVV